MPASDAVNLSEIMVELAEENDLECKHIVGDFPLINIERQLEEIDSNLSDISNYIKSNSENRNICFEVSSVPNNKEESHVRKTFEKMKDIKDVCEIAELVIKLLCYLKIFHPLLEHLYAKFPFLQKMLQI